MPFIWDDATWKFIDNEENYDKSRFVIVKKLHLRRNTINFTRVEPFEFTIDQIHRSLRKFGEISSIDLLPNKECEAHVTFVSDQSAYLVQLQYEYDRDHRNNNPFQIEPAATWEQPQEIANHREESNMESDAQSSEIFMLNEDCLLYLFKFLDLDALVNISEVCELFYRLAHQHFFPRTKIFEFRNSGRHSKMPLGQLRRKLRCIGPHITDLKYSCSFNPGFNSRVIPFLETMVENIGQNLCRLTFWNMGYGANTQLEIIKPILRNLESLDIRDNNIDRDYDVDFEELSPNLVELKLRMDMRLNRCCKRWARLQHLAITGNEFVSTTTFVSFIKLNPQLISLDFDLFDTNIRLRAMAEHLPLLQKLTMDSVSSNLAGWDLVHLSHLQHLTEINLLTLDYQYLSGIFDVLTTFSGLRKICLHAYAPDDDYSSDEDEDDDDEEQEEIDEEMREAAGNEQHDERDYEQPLINLAKQLGNLEEFSLRFIAVTNSTVMDFIRFAGQLKIIHIHSCRLKFTETFIWNLVNRIKQFKSAQNQPIKLFVSPNDCVNWHLTKNDDVKRYLEISSKCRHIGASE